MEAKGRLRSENCEYASKRGGSKRQVGCSRSAIGSISTALKRKTENKAVEVEAMKIGPRRKRVDVGRLILLPRASFSNILDSVLKFTALQLQITSPFSESGLAPPKQ